MLHIDLFSGIGGFAYAIDQVWNDVEHVFCDNEPFAQQVINKHWPGSFIYDDIRKITADTINKRLEGGKQKQAERQPRQSDRTGEDQESRPFILTGGFPCQPFSAAGLRKGTDDDRYLWPEMLRIIRLTKPQWIIAENVRGLLTLQGGVVFEQVCTDMEAEGYEVQPFIIPAVAVNAPHRRDRIWFVAYASSHNDGGTPRKNGGSAKEERLQERDEVRKSSQSDGLQPIATDSIDDRQGQTKQGSSEETDGVQKKHRSKDSTTGQSERTNRNGQATSSVADTKSRESGQQTEQKRRQGISRGNNKTESATTNPRRRDGETWTEEIRPEGQESFEQDSERFSWLSDWPEVAAELCSVDDGLPVELDGFKLSKPQNRAKQLSGYGNAIVPQVAVEIMRAIKEVS